MSEQSKPLSGKLDVTLPGLARSVSLVSAFAAVIFYQVVIGFPDGISMLMVYFPALVIGALVGWLTAFPCPRLESGGIFAAVGTTLIVASFLVSEIRREYEKHGTVIEQPNRGPQN